MTISNYIFSVFEQFCAEYKVGFHQINNGVFATFIRGNNGSLVIQSHINSTYLLFYSTIPVFVPYEKQQEVMELITLANEKRIIGNFEMDLKKGEVYFKTGISMLGGQLTTDTIYGLFMENFCTADQYLKSVCQVIYGKEHLDQVIQDLKGDEHEAEEDTEALQELLSDPDLDQLLDDD